MASVHPAVCGRRAVVTAVVQFDSLSGDVHRPRGWRRGARNLMRRVTIGANGLRCAQCAFRDIFLTCFSRSNNHTDAPQPAWGRVRAARGSVRSPCRLSPSANEADSSCWTVTASRPADPKRPLGHAMYERLNSNGHGVLGLLTAARKKPRSTNLIRPSDRSGSYWHVEAVPNACCDVPADAGSAPMIRMAARKSFFALCDQAPAARG